MFVRIARRSIRAFSSATNYFCFLAIAGLAAVASAQVQPQTAQPNYGQRPPANVQPQPAANQVSSGLRQPSGIVQTSGTDQAAGPVQQPAPQMQQPIGQTQAGGNPQAGGNVPQLRAGGVPLNVVQSGGNQQAGAPQVGTPQQTGVGQPPRQTLPSGAPVQPQVLNAASPFQLTPQQQADLERLLTDWENQGNKVKNFECKFTRWEYNPALVLNGGNKNLPTAVSDGVIKYAPPDRGLFRVDKTRVPDQTGNLVPSQLEIGEHWTCDGNSIFIVDHKQRTITENPLPPAMKGKAITNGPLPFVFGAKADALKARYYMRIITPPNNATKQVWLEARPKLQNDAANFSRVELILTKENLQPEAIQIFNPGADPKDQSRTVIQFTDISVNSIAATVQGWFGDFSKPNFIGYKHEKKDLNAAPPAAGPVANGVNPQPPAQAQKPADVRR